LLIGFGEHTDEPAPVTRNHPTTIPNTNTILHAPCMFQHCLAMCRDVKLSGFYYKVYNVTYKLLWYMLTHTLILLLQKVVPLFSVHVSCFLCCFMQEVIKVEDI
jgi:hypothetical protein